MINTAKLTCALFLAFPSLAIAAKPTAHRRLSPPVAFQCESVESELVGCASVPPDLPSPQTQESSRSNKLSLLGENELSGSEDLGTYALRRPSRTGLNPAMLASHEAFAQIRRVELFLKSGPASRGDLRVIEAQNPDLPK